MRSQVEAAGASAAQPIPPKGAPVKDTVAAQSLRVPQGAARTAAAIALEKEREAASARKKGLAEIAIVNKVRQPFSLLPFHIVLSWCCAALAEKESPQRPG